MYQWEDTIKRYLKELGWEVMGWIHVAQDTDKWRTFVNMERKFQFIICGKFLEVLKNS